MTGGFDLDWLRLREPHDLRARSRELGRQFGGAVRARARDAPAAIVDLGAGSGANFRALAPLIPGNQDWRLVDHDRDLLGHQAAEIAQWARGQGWRVTHGSGVVTVATGTAHWRAHSIALDLARDLPSLPLTAHGITCAALLDLVSPEWLEQLADRVAAARAPFLAALTIDGRRVWAPSHEGDFEIAKAYMRHQSRDKGFGAALGGEAPRTLSELFQRRGYRVTEVSADWRLGPDDGEMLQALVEDRATAALVIDASLPVERWRRAAHAAIAERNLQLTVGHVDFLAVADDSAR